MLPKNLLNMFLITKYYLTSNDDVFIFLVSTRNCRAPCSCQVHLLPSVFYSALLSSLSSPFQLSFTLSHSTFLRCETQHSGRKMAGFKVKTSREVYITLEKLLNIWQEIILECGNRGKGAKES